MSALYPLNLRLEGRPVTVIGAGPVAVRRIEGLLEAGARVRVVSPEADPAIEKLAREGRLAWERRRYAPGDLAGVVLAYLAAGDPELVAAVRAEADRGGILLGCASEAGRSDLHRPAVARREGVQVAVSTGGASPALARALRSRIDGWLSSLELGPAALEELRARRETLKRSGLGREKREKELRRLADQVLSRGLRRGGGGETARKSAVRPAKGESDRAPPTVHLVGAGPGDPGLLTVRARELLEKADVVYHDRLVSDEVLEVIPPEVERVYVGKTVGSANRASIGRLMIDAARSGRRVVRLKGGDPGLFGRVGEEMLELHEAGIDFDVVPGVSALSGVAGSVGIPLTYRGVASELIVRSGHRMAESDERGHHRDPRETTFVYFMAVGRIGEVVKELEDEGLPPSTPVAVVEKGTLPSERVVTGELETIVETLEKERIEPPALVIAGDVVRFHRLEEEISRLEGDARAKRAGVPEGPVPVPAAPVPAGEKAKRGNQRTRRRTVRSSR